MKNIYFVILILNLIACSQSETRDPKYYGPLTIEGFQFQTTKAPLFKSTVEASVFLNNGAINYIADVGLDHTVSLVTPETVTRFHTGLVRSYVFQHGSTYYYLFHANDSIYLSRSSDLITWVPMNNGNPVMTQEPGTIYGVIWNPSVAIDSNGVWHMLVECETNGDNAHAGLGYATATLNGDLISFDTNRTSDYVIRNAGNSWLTFVPNRGMLIVYGKISAPIGSLGEEWYVTAATMENGVFQENSNLVIGAPGIHVADPHIVETSSGLIMALSYDQHSVYEMRSSQTMEQFYDQVRL